MSAQGVELIQERVGKHHLGEGTARLHATTRRHITPRDEDRSMTPDLEKMIAFVRGRELLDEVQTVGEASGAGAERGGIAEPVR